MSEFAYLDDLEDIKKDALGRPCYKALQKLGWSFLTTAKQEGVECNKFGYGYYGTAFQHEGNKQIVIAHRGTKITEKNDKSGEQVLSGSGLTADLQLMMGEKPDQFKFGAKLFTSFIMEKYKNEYIISHTGHSLGASLAALSALKFKSCATIFDPFGIQNIICSDSQNNDFPKLPITSFLAPVNIVNGSAPHVGLVFQLVPVRETTSITEKSFELLTFLLEKKFQNWGKLSDLMRKDISLHNITDIRNGFDKVTGLPKSLYLVESWPDNLLTCLRFYRFLEKNGFEQRMLDPSALTNRQDVKKHRSFNYAVTPYGDKSNRLSLKYFGEDIQYMLRECKKNPEASKEKYSLDSAIIDVYKIVKDPVTKEEYIQTSEEMTVIDFKNYLERKMAFYNQKNQKPIVVKKCANNNDNSSSSNSNASFFKKMHDAFLRKTLPEENNNSSSNSSKP